MVRFAFVGRVSTEDLQNPEESRRWQLERATALIAGHGQVVAEFFDVGYSRSVSWLRRPESARLLVALEDPGRGFEAVVIGEPQRVFYDDQYGLIFPLFAHYRVPVWVPEIGGPIDPDSEAHNLIMTMYAGMSKAERRRIQVRVRAAMAAQAEHEGRFLGGRPPYGYCLVDAGPHHNPALAGLGARQHRLDLDPVAAPVVERIFAMRLAGLGASRIAKTLDAEGVPCPSANDPTRNRHRSGEGWSKGTVLSILANPRYTGLGVWNRQSKAEVLIDPHNVGLGTRTMMRWNPREEWISSRGPAHPAIVSGDDFQRAQCIRAVRGCPRSYLLRGLLCCGRCGRSMEGAWNNGRANYRCRHPRTTDAKIPCTVSVREDKIAEHLGALLIRFRVEATGGEFTEVAIPRDTADRVVMLGELGATVVYDHLKQTLSTEGGEAVTSLR